MALSTIKPIDLANDPIRRFAGVGVREQQALLRGVETALSRAARMSAEPRRPMARPRFVIVNVIAVALVGAAWQAGWLTGLAGLGAAEWAMLAFLGLYFGVGLAGAVGGNWRLVGHIADGLPMWALGFTGLGLVMAVAGLTSMTPETLLAVFRHLALAIVPNVFGVLLMIWLREISYWSGPDEDRNR